MLSWMRTDGHDEAELGGELPAQRLDLVGEAAARAGR